MSFNISEELSSLDKQHLITLCKGFNIKGYSGKNKQQLSLLISDHYSHQMPEQTVTVPKTTQTTQTTQNQIRFIDLFCGIGGFHQALKRLNGVCVFACDIDKHCREVYGTNYNLVPHDNITQVDVATVPDFDVLCAGFPCQAFSNAGNKQSFKDVRGTLFEHILRIAVAKMPRFMFLENVKHIKKIGEGKVFEHIVNRINESGYYVKNDETIFELSPHQLGVPQHRERVIFVCVRKDIYNASIQLNMTPPPNVEISFDKIILTDPVITDMYRIEPEVEEVLTAWDAMVQVIETGDSMSPTIMCNEFNSVYTEAEFIALPDWKQEYMIKNRPIYAKYKEQWDEWLLNHSEILKKREIFGKLEWQAGKKKQGDSIWDYFIQMRQSGIRVKKCDYFPTLVAIVQTPIYAKERRYITPRECARLQSFPDDFIMHANDKVAYKQFGNAVNVDVVHYVIERTLKAYGMV